jgi:prepilin-type N-terminal cleavage/methylation domain-containing protein
MSIRRRGFTLIELVFVIVIVVSLIAYAAPQASSSDLVGAEKLALARMQAVITAAQAEAIRQPTQTVTFGVSAAGATVSVAGTELTPARQAWPPGVSCSAIGAYTMKPDGTLSSEPTLTCASSEYTFNLRIQRNGIVVPQ